MFQLPRIDEERISTICEQMELYLHGRLQNDDFLSLLNEADSIAAFVREKTSRLRHLLSRKQISDLSDHRSQILTNIWAIGKLTRIQNYLLEKRETELRVFRVELDDPTFWDRSPLIFHARVFVDDTFSSSVRCVVTDHELSRLSIRPKSLSKPKARMRRIDNYYLSIRLSFERHIENVWRSGADLNSMKSISYSEANR